jgi:hypothetical protein
MPLHRLAAAALLGSLAIAAPRGAAANLLVNPGFEADPFFTGWTVSPSSEFTINVSVPFEGNRLTITDATSAASLSQTVTVAPGSTLLIEAQLWNRDATGNLFQIALDGTVLFEIIDAPEGPPQNGWDLVSATGVSVTGTSTVSFVFKRDVAVDFWYFDAASVTVVVPDRAVPEPGALALLGMGLLGLTALRRR